MQADLGSKLDLEILTDATAARGIASRTGLGKTRHIEVHYLWVQEKIAQKALTLSKVWGHENPADLLTKHLDAQTMQRHMYTLGLERMEGRSAEAPSLSLLQTAKARSAFPFRSAPTTSSHKNERLQRPYENHFSASSARAEGECGKSVQHAVSHTVHGKYADMLNQICKQEFTANAQYMHNQDKRISEIMSKLRTTTPSKEYNYQLIDKTII